jgi:gliding motility-associated-like protein
MNDQQISTGHYAQFLFENNQENDETKFIELIVTNSFGCEDTLRREFVVYPQPISVFSVTPSLVQRFPDATFEYQNLTTGIFETKWDFGDSTFQSGNTPNPTEKTYDTWGKYDVKVVSYSDHCIDSNIQTITVLEPYPIPGFTGGGELCSPASFEFTDTSRWAVAYLWDFGDTQTSTLQNPNHTYPIPGNYNVSLTVTGHGGHNRSITKSSLISVMPSADAMFYYSPEKLKANKHPVNFFNISTDATLYYWDFGDSTYSEEFEPKHVYTEENIFDVTLIANNSFNCPDTMIVLKAIDVEAGGSINFPNAFTPNLNGSDGGVYNPEAIDNDIFFPIYTEVQQFQMQIFNRWGEKVFESNDINVGWDGYINGAIAQQDVYVYKVKGVYFDNSTFEKVGEVTLMR